MGIEGGNAALEGALRQTTKAPPSFSTAYDLANQAVIAWLLGTGDYAGAVGYVESVATLVIRHTIETARPLVASWMGDTRSLEALIADLEATGFSRARAESIAITEVTRGYARGNLAAWQASGYVDGKRWETVADEVVCPVCGGLNQQEAPLDEPFSFDGNEYASPPAHPRCRCHVTPVLLPARGGG